MVDWRLSDRQGRWRAQNHDTYSLQIEVVLWETIWRSRWDCTLIRALACGTIWELETSSIETWSKVEVFHAWRSIAWAWPRKEVWPSPCSSTWIEPIINSCTPHPTSMGNTNSVPATTDRPLPKIKFRVLIIGRANAGKTSLLQRVCDTTDSPSVRQGNEEVRGLT